MENRTIYETISKKNRKRIFVYLGIAHFNKISKEIFENDGIKSSFYNTTSLQTLTNYKQILKIE